LHIDGIPQFGQITNGFDSCWKRLFMSQDGWFYGQNNVNLPLCKRCRLMQTNFYIVQDLEALLAFFDCPKAHWKGLWTTNIIERLFVEVRRRIRTMCAFTTRDSCERILFSVFDRMNQHWTRHPLSAFTHKS
jgi:hypothetical protein